MKDSKLQNISKDFAKDLEGFQVNSPTDVYIHIIRMSKEQPEYFFEYIGPKNLIKIIIYVWSLITTSNFKLADKIFSSMVFVELLDTKGEASTEECDNCDGRGRLYCSYCDGTGTLDCDECGGSGNQTCEECDGDGKVNCDDCDGTEVIDCETCNGSGQKEDENGNEIECEDCYGRGTNDCLNCTNGSELCKECNGEGDIPCDDCGGDGKKRCWDCSGQGDYECSECGGEGEIEKENHYDISISYLIIWNPQLIKKINSNKDSGKPIIPSHKLIDYENTYIMTDREYESEQVNIQDNMYYGLGVDDDPELTIMANGNISWAADYNIIDILK